MISYIKGKLTDILAEYVIVECQNIGYAIRVPISFRYSLGEIGSEVKVYTYLQVKEDGISLYGFRTPDERRVFELLIGVSGIGPKGALAILSELSIDALHMAVISDDAKAIAKAPGVGLKTAKKIILELKDKLKVEDFTGGIIQDSNSVILESDAIGEALQALEALGYTQSEAAKAIRSVPQVEDMNVEEVLKAALKALI
jgi:Holliday junction DNA helicase RuvA